MNGDMTADHYWDIGYQNPKVDITKERECLRKRPAQVQRCLWIADDDVPTLRGV